MTFDAKRGLLWAIVFFVIWVPSHLYLMPWLAQQFSVFERWNYGEQETLTIGAGMSILGGLIFALWKPKS